MYAGRGLLKTVLLERGVPGGELLNTEWIEDYPGFKKIKGRDLAQAMTEHAREFGAEIRQENVESIVRRDDGVFEIATTLGGMYEAPAVEGLSILMRNPYRHFSFNPYPSAAAVRRRLRSTLRYPPRI